MFLTFRKPRVDPLTSELIFFGSSFLPPYVRYTVISPSGTALPSLLAHPVAIPSPKLMHDFGVSLNHTVILDMPLSFDPTNLVYGKPLVQFDHTSKTRFGVFPRYRPGEVQWYESEACAIFHTANTWSDETAVNLLACRFLTAKLIYAAGGIRLPSSSTSGDTCHLYYYRFPLSIDPRPGPPQISHQFAISSIPFEFPTVSHNVSMQNAQFIYGCTMRVGSFDAALGGAAHIDCVVRLDVGILIKRGIAAGLGAGDTVDSRSVLDILASKDETDPIKIFAMPPGWYAQECFFVPKKNASHEAEGYLLTYVFDESQLRTDGAAPEDAISELWILNADNMKDVVARIRLPQRG